MNIVARDRDGKEIEAYAEENVPSRFRAATVQDWNEDPASGEYLLCVPRSGTLEIYAE